jgi:hypothetical protein
LCGHANGGWFNRDRRSHLSPDIRTVLHRLYGDKYHLKIKEQGFITVYGDFVDRQSGWLCANANGQIHIYNPVGEEKILQPPNQPFTGDERLFSENLY